MIEKTYIIEENQKTYEVTLNVVGVIEPKTNGASSFSYVEANGSDCTKDSGDLARFLYVEKIDNGLLTGLPLILIDSQPLMKDNFILETTGVTFNLRIWDSQKINIILLE